MSYSYSFPLGADKQTYPLPFYPPTSYLQGFLNKMQEDVPRQARSVSPDSVIRRLRSGENPNSEEGQTDLTYLQLYRVILRFRGFSYFYRGN